MAQLLTKCGMRHIARVMAVYLSADPVTGPRAAAAIVECLAPTAAVRFTYDMFDQLQPLLPQEARKQVLAACGPKVAAALAAVQAELNALALKRARQVRVGERDFWREGANHYGTDQCASCPQAQTPFASHGCLLTQPLPPTCHQTASPAPTAAAAVRHQIRILLQCFVSKHAISSVQLDRVLRALRYEQDRCSAMVTLWPHVIDRAGLYTPFQTLSAEEQRQVWGVRGCGGHTGRWTVSSMFGHTTTIAIAMLAMPLDVTAVLVCDMIHTKRASP